MLTDWLNSTALTLYRTRGSTEEHKEWGTLIFNYGRHEVRNFLISNALFWFEKYHIDGIRVDAVADAVLIMIDYMGNGSNSSGGRENLEAIDFFQELLKTSSTTFANVLSIAEESTSWDGVTRHPTMADWVSTSNGTWAG